MRGCCNFAFRIFAWAFNLANLLIRLSTRYIRSTFCGRLVVSVLSDSKFPKQETDEANLQLDLRDWRKEESSVRIRIPVSIYLVSLCLA